MAARVDGEDAVGRAVASDLMERRLSMSGDASRPSDDPTSPRAWFETALRSIRDGRCHAYCAAPGMPSAVLWSAWEALGPPPPPDHLAVPDVESADPNADPNAAGEQWRALLESSTLASCARCVRAYRAQVDRWDSAAETAQTEEEHDAAVLAALLRERDDARLQSQADALVASFGREFRETVGSEGADPCALDVVTRTRRDENATTQNRSARLDATMHEAFAFVPWHAMESAAADALRETAADLAVAAGAARVGAALATFESESESESESETDEADRSEGASHDVRVTTFGLGDAPGAFEFLAHPRREDVRRTMEACFRLATKKKNTPARTSRGNDFGVVRTRRPVRAMRASVATIVAGWAETVWTEFEAGQKPERSASNPRANAGTNDVRLNANTKKSIAWRALAVSLRACRAAPRSRVLDLHPELVDAALDELSVSTTKARADGEGDGGDERATAPVSVVADAARVIAELVSADAGSYWADARSAPMTTACAVLESAARSAPERNAHEACVAAVAAALFSASSAAIDAENLPEASQRALAEGSRRATEFLCATVPGAPHLFDERVAWRARRAALDVVRAGYQAGRPPCEPSVRDAWLRTLGEAGKPPPATHAHRDSADDRATARVSAAAATASALRADAAALAALEHTRARAAGEFLASFFFPDVDEFSFHAGIHAFAPPSLDKSSSRDAASLLGTYAWEDDEDASALKSMSLDARLRECASAAFAARAEATAGGGWRCAAATRAKPLTDPFFVSKGTSSEAFSRGAATADGVVVSAALAAAAELALAPSEEKREARRRGVPPPAPAASESADVAVPGDGDASRLATRMAADLGDALVSFAALNAYPLARAASPSDAIRAAVALFLGQRDALRAAGKALLVAQALGPGSVTYASFSATGANVAEVWTRVCAFPESRRAALEGAILAARAAAASTDPGDRLAAAAQVAHHARPLLVSAEAADLRDAEEARTLAAAASRRDADASRTCVSLRVAFAEATFDLVAETVGEAAELAAETWAQGDLIKAFRALPGAFATRYRRNGEARSTGARAGDRATALWWVPGCLRLCGARRTPAVTRHWCESLDATLAASVETGAFESVADFPAEAKAAARGAFAELENRRRASLAVPVPSRDLQSDETALSAIRDVLARHFPSEAPGNLGVGLLESLPSRSRTAAPKPVSKQGRFLADDVERVEAEALHERRRKEEKPSLRERLASSVLAPTATERLTRDVPGRGGGGFAADPLDSWNADRGGFASYPADADEPDVGDAVVVDDDDDDDDGFEIIDRFGDDPPVARRRGLGPAVEDRLLAQSPYERSLARARADAGSSVNRRGGSSRGAPSRTDADILADVRAGGPTHKPKKTLSEFLKVGGTGSFAGRRDFGSSSETLGATVSAVREASAAKEGMIRERAELAGKRERERAEAKAAREKRLAEKHWEREHVIALDGAGEPASRTAAAVVHLAPAAAAPRGVGGNARGFNTQAFQPPNRFGGLRGRLLGPGLRDANAALLRGGRFDAPPEPPWVVPECDDLVAVALRWSAAHALRAADRSDATEDDGAKISSPPETFPSGRAYVEHFAPLLLAELRAQIGSSMEEAGGVAPGVPAPGVVESIAARTRERSAFHVARVALGRSREGAASSFQTNDLVLLEKKASAAASTAADFDRGGDRDRRETDPARRTSERYHAFGVVEGVETGAQNRSGSRSWSGASVGGRSSAETSHVTLRVRVCLVEEFLPAATKWLTGNGGGPLNAPDERERRDGVLRAVSRRGAAVTVSRVASLTPPLREMAALLATCRAGGFAGAASAFLRPSRASRAADDSHAPRPASGVDAATLASAVAGLNPPQERAVRAAAETIINHRGEDGRHTNTRVVLVQGPPGTGKTRVIAATVDAVLAGATSDDAKPPHQKNASSSVLLSPAKYGAAAVAARRRRDDRRRRLSVDGGATGGASGVRVSSPAGGSGAAAQATTRPSSRRRVLVCAQSNSAVDELVARLASAFEARGDRTLVRLGREDVTREDARPFLVTRLVDDRRRVDVAEAARGEARGGGGGGAGVGVASSADDSASVTRARLERLGEEIRAEETKEASSLVSGVSRARGVASVHLDMLHAQRRRLLGELAALKQSEKKNRVAEASSFGGVSASPRGSSGGGGSAWSRVVAGADVVCATLSGAGLLAADHRAKGSSGNGRGGGSSFTSFTSSGASRADDASKLCATPLFDAVIVDEAAQATELATLIPLRWLKPGGVAVLVGDPKQLAPTVLAKSRAVERCLSRSLFERMQRAGARAHLLSVQYRMHPSIRAFPSSRFYGSRLVDGTPAGSRVSPLGANYACVDCAGGFEVRRRSTSNPVEVSVCVAVYAQLVRNLRLSRRDAEETRAGATTTTVGVVTPYRDQLEALRRGFARVTDTNPDARLAPVEFATVDGVQGREFDVVLFSCVRANKTTTTAVSERDVDAVRDVDDDADDASPADIAAALRSRRAIGFLADKRRLNVALTRPRAALVVVGHATTLRAADSTWRSLWEDAARRGAVVEVAGSGGSARDALFSFRADGSGTLNAAKETSVPEAVVDLAESEESEDDGLLGAVDEMDDAITPPEITTAVIRPLDAGKRVRGGAASVADVVLPAKRARNPSPKPKPAPARVRSSVPVAPIASVTRREKKVTTTTRAADVADAKAAATARAKAALDAGGSGGRASTARVVAPPAKKKKTTDLVGSILKGMRRE